MRRILLIVISTVLIAALGFSLFFVFWYVPNVLGMEFVSVSFRPLFYPASYDGNSLHLVYEGRAVNASFVSVEVNVTNNYFLPVRFGYNGFDVVWLVYSQRVSYPLDVDGNRAVLVYGAYSSLNMWVQRYSGINAFSTGGYQTYDRFKNLSNFTATLNAGVAVSNMDAFFTGSNEYECWLGRWWLNNSYVSPGTYFMYCVILGLQSNPQNVTITSTSES
jgi:hypothetical protein